MEVLQIFAKLATEPDSRLDGKSYTEILHQKADHLQRLVHLKEKHKERLQAEIGWLGHSCLQCVYRIPEEWHITSSTVHRCCLECSCLWSW